MDMFIEKLVTRQRQGKDYAIAAFAVFLTLLLSLISFVLIGGLAALAFLVPFLPLIIGGFFFLCYRIISRQNIEFEYSLTNNELDVDKIFARRKRKRIVTVNARNFDIFAPTSNFQFNQEKGSPALANTYDCSSSSKDANTYFIIFFGVDGRKSMLIFEPNQKMIDGFKRYAPNKVIDV